MKSEAVIRELLPLQDAFNRKVNQNWPAAGYAWHRAIWMECAELIEGTQAWKWWKGHGVPDVAQLQLEVIDILHFLLSWGLVEQQRHGADYALDTIGGAMTRYEGQPINFKFEVPSVIVATERVAAAAASMNYHATVEAFTQLCQVAQLNVQDLRRMYVGKNALNTVRNLNGYKAGTYQKIWRGEEDNVVLERLMSQRPDIAFQELIDTLTARYKEIHA